MDKDKIKILYFYDALCGWCYGFSPVIEIVKLTYEDKFDFEIISGGLKLGEEAGPIGVVAPYIKAGAYKAVEQRCGVKFGDAFVNGPLQEGTMILNSFQPAIALSIVKQQKPEKAFEFGSILHKAIYVDGLHPENVDGYGLYAEKIGLDGEEFINLMNDKLYQELAQEDFNLSKKYGITGFPTLVGMKGDSAFLISNGFMDFQSISSRLDEF